MSRVASWEEYFFFSLPSFPTHQLGLLCYGCFGIAVSRVASWEEYFFFVAFFSYPSVGFVVLWLFWYSCVESCFLGRVFFFRCLLFLPINWVCCVMAVFGIAVSRVASWEEYFFFVAFFSYPSVGFVVLWLFLDSFVESCFLWRVFFFFVAFFSYPSVGFVVLWLFWYSCVESCFLGRVFFFSLPSFPTHQLGLLCYGCFGIAVSRVASWEEYFFFSLPSFPTHQLGLLCYGCFGIAVSRVASWEEYFFFSLPSFPTHLLGLLCYGCFWIAVSRVASWEEYFFFVAFFSSPSVGFVVLWLFWYSCVESCFLGRVFFFRCLLFLPISWVCCVMAVFGIAVSRVASWEEYFFFVAFFSYPSVGFVVLWLFWYSCVASCFLGRVFFFSLPSFPTHQLGLLCYGCFGIAVSRVDSREEYLYSRCLLFLPISWVCCVMAVFG